MNQLVKKFFTLGKNMARKIEKKWKIHLRTIRGIWEDYPKLNHIIAQNRKSLHQRSNFSLK